MLTFQTKVDDVTCLRCGAINDFIIEGAGPHLKAVCNQCDKYIKFLSKQFVYGMATKRKEYASIETLRKTNLERVNSYNMAADIIIHGRIKIEDLIREWFFKGEKGTYLDFTLFYSATKDQYGQNGMITQSVPESIWKPEVQKNVPAAQRTKGPILGNCIVFEKGGASKESMPGYTGQPTNTPVNDPFAATGQQQQTVAPGAPPQPVWNGTAWVIPQQAIPNASDIKEPLSNLPF